MKIVEVLFYGFNAIEIESLAYIFREKLYPNERGMEIPFFSSNGPNGRSIYSITLIDSLWSLLKIRIPLCDIEDDDSVVAVFKHSFV